MLKRKANRLKDYHYSQAGCYFVTICTKDKVNHFGSIRNDKMILNNIGKIAYNNWQNIKNHFDNVELDVFVIMPNHIHGIVNIIEPDYRINPIEDAHMRPNIKTLQSRTKMALSKIIQQYKSSVTRDVNARYKNYFGWQRSFYEHIIRNDKSFYNIQEYIYYNPMKWAIDIENRLNKNPDKMYYEKLFK